MLFKRLSSFKLLLCAILISSSLTVALESPLPGYDVRELTWTLPLPPDGVLQNLTGTVEQIHARLSENNPDLATELLPQAAGSLGRRRRMKRYDIRRHSCDTDLYSVPLEFKNLLSPYRDALINGIRYLNKVKGLASMGPQACGRVSCSYKTAIWWCNHNEEEKALEGFDSIAEGAQWIMEFCSRHVTGQVEYKDGWSVLVRFDNNHC